MTTLADLIAGNTPAPAPAFTDVARIPIVDLALPLMDFQQEAVEWVLNRADYGDSDVPFAYVALDMGLGKTPVGISVAVSCISAGHGKALIVVPPSLRLNWEREISTKFAPHLSVAVLTGTKPYALPDVDVLIIGDSTISHWEHALLGKVGCVIVDEGHRHKNSKSKRAKSLVNVAQTARGARVLLSGTPMPNGRHEEMAMQFSVLGKGAWNSIRAGHIQGKGAFYTKYSVEEGRYGRVNANAQDFHKDLSQFMIRRKREDVIDLPNKGRSGVSFDCAGKSSRDYISAENDLRKFLADKERRSDFSERAEALVLMNTLRRLAGEAKVPAIVEHAKEILDDTSGGVFIVAEHKDVMDDLLIKLAKYNPVSVRGGMSDSAKQDAVDAFTSGQSRVMVGQIIAAGVGLTLHGNGLNHRVIVAQLPWTPADLRQAEDRLHRIGQTNDVMVEVALAHIDGRWTIDERLWTMLESKNFATGEAIDGEGDFLMEGSLQDGVLDTYR